MDSTGVIYKGETFTVYAQVSNPTSGAEDDAGTPTYSIYDQSVQVELDSGTMTEIDHANVSGFYGIDIEVDDLYGYVEGHDYAVRVYLSIDGVAAAECSDGAGAIFRYGGVFRTMSGASEETRLALKCVTNERTI